MGPWFKGFVIADAGMFVLGWILVFATGYGGSSQPLVGRVGAVMVYVSVPTLIVGCLVFALAGVLSKTIVRLRH